MTIAEFLADAPAPKDVRDPRRYWRRILAHRIGCRESMVLAAPDSVLEREVLSQLNQDMDDVRAGKPEAYLLGHIPFLDWEFTIDERALIPRPETEALMDLVFERLKSAPPAHVLDLCCGSGIMGLSAALRFPEASVTLTDLCDQALALAAENRDRHGLEERVTLHQGDLWHALPDPLQRFDLIVANPPYVGRDEPLGPGVAEWEPETALYSENQGMAHIQAILAQLSQRLNPGGMAAFELGHQHHHKLSPRLSDNALPGSFEWARDPFNVPRYLIYQHPDTATRSIDEV